MGMIGVSTNGTANNTNFDHVTSSERGDIIPRTQKQKSRPKAAFFAVEAN